MQLISGERLFFYLRAALCTVRASSKLPQQECAMPTKTDPARELSDLIRGLEMDNNLRFDHGLAQMFDVEAWSSEFYQIVFTISARIDELVALTDTLPLDDDHKDETKVGLQTIQSAFGPNGLQNPFSHSKQHYLSAAQVAPLSTLSGLVRPIRPYPKLNGDEQADILAMVDELLGWLEEHQLSEQDFIRQALLDGLVQLRFRLKRIKWLGWGYTLQGLHDVIAAYFALERGFPQDGSNPPAQAMLKFVGEFFKGFFEKAGFAKETVELGDFMLKAYGTVQLLLAGKTTIAGLLTYAG